MNTPNDETGTEDPTDPTTSGDHEVVGIKQIAALARVSVSTVSKVLNNKTDVSAATRARVVAVCRQQNYRRRVSAVANRGVGIIVPLVGHGALSAPYTSTVFFGAVEYLLSHGYRAEIMPAHTVARVEAEFLRNCTESNVEGVIFIASTLNDPYIAGLAEVIPVVTVANHFDGANLVTVCYDAYEAAQLATVHLIDMGHRRIGFLCEDQVHHDQVMRRRAFDSTMAQRFPDYRPPQLVSMADYDRREVAGFFAHVMGQPEPPTAFVISNDMMAMVAIEALHDLGVGVPEQVSIVGFDDLPFSRHLRPPLTTVSQPTHELGRLAAVEIDRRLSGDEVGSRDVVLRGHLIIRDSACPPAATTS